MPYRLDAGTPQLCFFPVQSLQNKWSTYAPLEITHLKLFSNTEKYCVCVLLPGVLDPNSLSVFKVASLPYICCLLRWKCKSFNKPRNMRIQLKNWNFIQNVFLVKFFQRLLQFWKESVLFQSTVTTVFMWCLAPLSILSMFQLFTILCK